MKTALNQAIESGALYPRSAPSPFWERKGALSTSRSSSASCSPSPIQHRSLGLISPQNKRGTTILCTLVLASTGGTTNHHRGVTRAADRPRGSMPCSAWRHRRRGGGVLFGSPGQHHHPIPASSPRGGHAFCVIRALHSSAEKPAKRPF